MSSRAGSTSIGLGEGLRDAVGRLERGSVVRPARRPPPFAAFAVDQGTNQLALGGDIGKRRQVDPQRQRLATPPALLLIDQQNVEPIDRERIGMRRQKREHIRRRNARPPRAGKNGRPTIVRVPGGVQIHRRVDPRRLRGRSLRLTTGTPGQFAEIARAAMSQRLTSFAAPGAKRATQIAATEPIGASRPFRPATSP